MAEMTYRFGKVGNVVIQFFIYLFSATILYWAFVDPQIGWFSKTYDQPWFVFFFWLILVLAWFAFAGEMWAFHGIQKQPWRGIVSLATMVAVTLLVIWFLCGLWGHFDPTFAWSRENHLGKVTASFYVLIGFVFFSHWSVNWQHYPWTDAGLKQPWVGLAEWLSGCVVTTVFFMFLIYPHFAPWSASKPLMSFPVTVGWFYACLEIFLFMFIWDNWPFSACDKRWQQAIFAFFGLFIFGTVLYWINLFLLKAIFLPEAFQKAIGAENVPLFVAQFEVFTSAFVIFWGTSFLEGPWPTKYSPHVNRLIRLILAIVVTIVFFYVYYLWYAGSVLHEPALAGTAWHGNALGFIDWFILINLIWYCCFGQMGMYKPVKQSLTE